MLQLVGSFHQGGSERQAVQLTRLLRESGRFRVSVACLDGAGVLRAEAERAGVGDIPEFALTSFYDRRMIAQLRRFARHLREREVDIVHTHDFYTNVFGMLGASLARAPVRVASRRETGGMRTRAQKFVERRAYDLAHAVVANAGAVRDQLAAEGVRADKIEIVYNGLDAARLRADGRLARPRLLELAGLPAALAGRPLVTLVANMRHDVKDHPMFLRAARRVKDEVPGAAFALAGEGELEESLRALAARLDLAGDVFFAGRCARVAELLAASDVCVLTSKAEGFSNAILEYMAAARPVVATDVGGAREAVVEGESGHLVPAGDDGATAARVVALLRDPERARRMGERGRRIVEERFSCAAQLERTERLYERLLRTRGRAAEGLGRARVGRAGRGLGGRVSARVSLREGGGAGVAAGAPRRRLRVLVVAASTDILGGQAVQAARLVAGLREEPSLEVSFQPINPRLPGALARLQSVKYVRTLVTSLAYWAQLLARVPRCDVVHAFSASYFSFLLAPTPALVAAKLCGRRALLNYHSGEAEDHLRRWRRTAVPTARLFDMIAVPSEYLVEVFARFGLPARAVFNHVDAGVIPYRERAPLRPAFLSNRNLEPHYNVGCVLRAFARIKERLPGARLTVAGDGSQRAELESLARSLGLEGVEFLGQVAPERMPALYAASDVFLNASEVDNMPLSIIEAYAAGLPVVTTDAGGIPHIVAHEQTGLLVPRGDADALASAALRLFEDEGLARRVAANARAECRKYSWEAVRGEWLKLYEELAGGGAGLVRGGAAEGAYRNG